MVSSSILISIARMHHISNPSKFRRLKRFAEHADISGFVKTGKPGVLVFGGEKDSVKTFLEHARGLRYLDFRHVDTKVSKTRVADVKRGLHEVNDMTELVSILEDIGEKEWFRQQMGMSKG